jgi:MtN3 and saliva related transmembrane protein
VVALDTLIGAAAAFCTTVSYVPQLRKCWSTGETGDLSQNMLLLLATGLGLWLVYGFMKADAVIVIANAVSLALLGGILFLKIRGPSSQAGRRSCHQRPLNGKPTRPATRPWLEDRMTAGRAHGKDKK